MSDLLAGYAVFHWIATWSHPALDVFFRVVTDLGNPFFYFLAIAPLFWVVDRRRALVLFMVLLLSGWVNAEAKLFADTPRPDPTLIRVLDLRPLQSGSRAFPSGHAQIALAYWGYLALWVNRRWATALAFCLVAAISFSRLYLGAHFPVDVVGGLLIGAVILATAPWFDRWAAADFAMPPAARLGIALVAAAGMLTSSDAAVVTICGCVLALITLLSLTPVPISLSGSGQVAAVVVGGITLQILCAALFGQFSPPGPVTVMLGLRVAALWLIALWAYPYAVSALLARRQGAAGA